MVEKLKKNFRNKTFVAAALLIAGLVFFLAGKYLQKIYGLDPPYIYFRAGFLLESAAYIFFVIFFLILLLMLWRRLKNRNN